MKRVSSAGSKTTWSDSMCAPSRTNKSPPLRPRWEESRTAWTIVERTGLQSPPYETCEHPTSNIQLPTSNHPRFGNRWVLDVGCWMLDVFPQFSSSDMSAARKNIMLGTAGHVDHGKSALVKLLTGCETDTLAEEKQRGLTIDLGFAPCRLADDRIVGVVDVPGHVDFIRNMVAGAHGVDVVIFVVAADDGIMPQTREHLHILTLMGMRHCLIALAKVDLVAGERRDAVIEDLRRLLAGIFLANAPISPISNITGEGFEGFFDALNQVVSACDDRSSAGLFRVWVEDVFTIRGPGTVVTGIPSSGLVKIGDPLTLLPAGRGRS